MSIVADDRPAVDVRHDKQAAALAAAIDLRGIEPALPEADLSGTAEGTLKVSIVRQGGETEAAAEDMSTWLSALGISEYTVAERRAYVEMHAAGRYGDLDVHVEAWVWGVKNIPATTVRTVA